MIYKTYICTNLLEKILDSTLKFNYNENNTYNTSKYIVTPKFRLSNLYKHKFNKTIPSENKITTINKLFEGHHLEINTSITGYKFLQIFKHKYIKNTSSTVLVFVNFINNKNEVVSLLLNNNEIFSDLYSSSLISFPITFNDVKNINNYIYYIYKFMYLNTLNVYKSSITALFYYFIGFFLAVFSLYADNNIKILYSNLIIIATKLSNFIMIESCNGVSILNKYVDTIKLINIINNSLYFSGKAQIVYRPYLIGITTYTIANQGILSKLSFQNTLKTLQSIILYEKIDWKIDTKSNLITADFTPIGSGWYRYFTN
uniref:RpoC2b n=2 Tax=Babesia TaxID=5864 RepID=A0A411ADA6_9APIC|nr:RpoC2b [Babesia sp. Lintan]QAX27054.1 RpoC2b [Babesia motasi]QAX27085.1 RpoC2b [Babesia motasi]